MKYLIRKIVVGYDEIEPAILTALALKRNIFIEGKHGIGKTALGKTLGRAVDSTGNGFRFYDAPKSDLIAIGGLPDMERSSKTGCLTFIESKRSIWGAKVVLVDELPRANTDRQNYWLEILEEGTFQGQQTGHEMVIATGNGSTYIGNFEFDLALKSRFMFFLPGPDFSEVSAGEVVDMIQLNLKDGRPSTSEVGAEINDLLENIRKDYILAQNDQDLVEQIANFIGAFTQLILRRINANKKLAGDMEAYVSPRTFASQMPQAMLGLYSYFKNVGHPDPLREAGKHTINYSIKSRHATAGDQFTDICNMAWRQLNGLLVSRVNTPVGKLKYRFASAITPHQKMGFWQNNLTDAIQHLDDCDMTTMAGDTLQQIQKDAVGLLGSFWNIMKGQAETQHLGNEVFGCMVTEIVRKTIDQPDGNNRYDGLKSRFASTDSLTTDNVSTILEA